MSSTKPFARAASTVLLRLLGVAGSTFAAAFALFAALDLAPGDPVSRLAGAHASARTLHAIRHQLGLDQPLLTRFWHWLTGLFHGDFQTNNILFHEGRLKAVLDWEISGLGANLMDLGWLLMMNDPESWYDGAGLSGVPPFDGLVNRYSDAAKRSVTLADVAFYRALSGYRFGVISGLNVMLHRTGKRPDASTNPITAALSIERMPSRKINCKIIMTIGQYSFITAPV